jgi:hypothetical protein
MQPRSISRVVHAHSRSHPMRATLPVVLACSLLLLAACAQRGAEAASFSTSDCRPVPFPDELPPADQLVDTDALAREVTAVWAWAELDPGEVTLSMAYDEEGLNIRREVIQHTTTPVAADSIQQLVFAALREVEEEERPWTVRLTIEANQGVRFATARSVFCPPRPRDPDMERAMRSVQFRGPRIRGGVRTRTVIVRTTIDANGRVAAAQARTGPPLDTRMQHMLIDHLRGFFFEPARLDGLPTRGTLDIPVQIRGI